MFRFLASIFLLVSQSTLAITNIESQRLNDTSLGTKGNISFTLDGEIGESDEFTLGSAITLIRSYVGGEWIVLLDREYSEIDDEVNTDETLVHLRHLTQHSPHWGHEVFTQYEEDLFADLAKRAILGAGARYTLNADPELKTANHFGLGAFYEDEEYADNIIEDNEQNVRLNIYWAYRNRLAENMTYTSTLYFQPDVEEFADNKGLWQNAVTISVTTTISLSVTWNALYDTHAPDGEDDTEFDYKSIIIYNF
jgi:putative salt-induced outer membrane protein YdiY